jgi:hypothetical protein
MSPSDHTGTPGRVEAAGWLSAQAGSPRLSVPVLRAKFGLSAKQACEAIALARTTP